MNESNAALLFAPIEPNQTFWLDVDDVHRVYVETSGNPKGTPVLFIHGGPGGGSNPQHRRFFDPERYHIILFDQRGCGQSTPHGSLKNNTIDHLIADMERIREHLGISQWALFGGSWGSTLALAYAQAYPERVLSMVLRGIFLCRPQDIRWFYQFGASQVFPDFWEDFLAPIPDDERDDLVRAYYRRLVSGSDEAERLACAKAWSVWEGSTSTLEHDEHLADAFGQDKHAIAMARIECHYFVHGAFMEPSQLQHNVRRIAHIPTTIVHGRYDLVCPIRQAFDLAENWPEADLVITETSGHSAFERENIEALIAATNRYANQIAAA